MPCKGLAPHACASITVCICLEWHGKRSPCLYLTRVTGTRGIWGNWWERPVVSCQGPGRGSTTTAPPKPCLPRQPPCIPKSSPLPYTAAPLGCLTYRGSSIQCCIMNASSMAGAGDLGWGGQRSTAQYECLGLPTAVQHNSPFRTRTQLYGARETHVARLRVAWAGLGPSTPQQQPTMNANNERLA